MLHTKFQFIWLRGFQRRRLKCEKLTEDRQWMPSDGKSSHCLWQGELKRERIDIKLTSLTCHIFVPVHVRTAFSSAYFMVFVVLNDVR